MKDRFYVANTYICTFSNSDEGNLVLTVDSERKLCVIDFKNNISIDVETNLKYDYFKTLNGKYFIDDSNNLIEPNKKVSAFPVAASSLDRKSIEKVYRTILDLESGKTFIDGNTIKNNESVKNNKKKIKKMEKK